MAATMLSLAVMVLCVLGVQGECEPEVIKKIFAIWNGNPPYDILPRLVGNQTYFYFPTFYDKYILDGLKCAKTGVDLDKVSTTDYHIYGDSKKNEYIYYDMVEEEEGIITNIHDDFEDQMYIVYFKHGVFAIYQCGEGYDPFVYMTVVNCDQKNLRQTASIAEATATLLTLGKPLGKKSENSECCQH